MGFMKTIGILATIAATASALPQGFEKRQATSTSSAPSTSSSAASSGSGIQIVNNMDSTVYLWSTSNTGGSMQTLPSGGGTYSEDWQTNSDGGGISIKMSTSQSEDSVLQFEYTQNGDTLYWDLSSINLDSSSDFVSQGFQAIPSDSSCNSATCAAGDSSCAQAYQHPDDVDTNSCSLSSGFTLTLG
ncbi:hypothetical protein N7510_001976 [Penicillium lagena]|uniref:uncharacterized protein n=1 Tax=Penicillium lagena TaxID=94218 RepID=UPI002541D863|nr:uncharacterized protein N7510_001976 [Penicillium lagena]KAJ5625667.1 hypothetical protein N7510_001976 [Penicillium lagena]